MKKQIFSLSMVITVLFGCASNRNGSYTKMIFKTSNNKIIVTGTIYEDNKNKGTLPGVAITSADRKVLTRADSDGKYWVELQEGKHMLRASYLGFKIVSTKRFNFIKGDSLVIDFILKDANEILY